MDNLPVHMRITSLTPTNEDVDARRLSYIAQCFSALGFPIGEVGHDGSVVVTKVEGSGGRVTAATSTVSERVAALRGALDAAVAEKQAEEAAEKARQEAEAAAQAKAEQEAAAAASSSASAPIVTSGGGSGDNSVGGAQATARGMLAGFGWGDDQFSCLVSLWNKESGWNVRAYNAGSGAYGIPQALPGSKMGSAGADWETNAATQISWGLGYISGRYGDPCGAWGHSQSTGWY